MRRNEEKCRIAQDVATLSQGLLKPVMNRCALRIFSCFQGTCDPVSRGTSLIFKVLMFFYTEHTLISGQERHRARMSRSF